MRNRFDTPRLSVLSALAAGIMLSACGGGGSSGGGSDVTTPPPATSASLGLMRITINGIGDGQMTSHAEMLSGTSGPQAHAALPTPVPAGLDVQQVSASTIDVGTRGAGGERYFTVVYQVRNAQFCDTPGTCTPYATASHNLSLVAANVPGNIDNTAISNLTLYDGTSNSDTQALATSLLPTHGMEFNAGAGSGVLVRPGLESLQVFTEDEVAAIPRDPGATDLFPYGYVVRNVNTPASRSLPATPANSQWDGEVSFSFKLPLQSNAKLDPYSITLIFQVVDDANIRVTESAEEQTIAGDVAASLRAATLGSVDLAVLGGRVAQTNIGDPICTVRTGGIAGAPTATLASNAGVTLAAAPYGISGVSPAAPVNVGFCAPMNAADFSSFIVSGSESGLRASGAPYGGSYGASALNNILSFTPDQPFLPGETVSYTLIAGLSGISGGALAQAFTGSYVVGGLVPSSATYVPSAPITGGVTPFAVAVGDFNGDGKPDFAIAWVTSNTVQVQYNNGDGTFTAGPMIGGFDSPGGLAVGDFNGDGHLDLVVTSYGFSSSPLVSVLLNDGSGNLAVVSAATPGNAPQSPVVGDFNGDGYPDVAVANSADSTISILLNDGSGHLTSQPPFRISTSSGNPKVLAVGDFNGDGTLDLAMTIQIDNVVQVLLNDGHANFSGGARFTVGGSPYALAAGDLNGDGIADLAVSVVTGTPDFVRPLYGDGKGGFTAGANLAVGDTPTTIVIGDFNGDGRPDLAVGNEGNPSASSISILLNNSKGGFSAARNMAAGGALFAIAAGDFNGDGRLDLVNINNTADSVTVFTSQP